MRWSLVFVLLMALLLEVVLISNKVLLLNDSGTARVPAGGATPSVAGAVTLQCRVVGVAGANVRREPTTDADNVITTLAANETVTAVGRVGDVPWLLVELETERGWVSSRLAGGQPLVECEGDPATLPEVGPDLAANDEPEPVASPTATLAPTLEPTLAPPPPITAPPGVRLREGNGDDLRAGRRTVDVTIDGSLTEWASAPLPARIDTLVFERDNSWTGAADLSGVVRALWDEQFLYLAVSATDDAIVQQSKEDLLIRGDAVEFFWDAELQEDFDEDAYSADDGQLVTSPGNFAGNGPSAWVYRSPLNNFRDQIEVAATRTARGYDLEARIPWAGLGITPGEGLIFGYAVALSDDDSPGEGNQEAQVSTTRELPFQHPTNWGNLALEP